MQYGHAMKVKYGVGFKRHTKLDDSKLCVYMDIFLPKHNSWARVDMDVVRRDNDGRQKSQVKIAEADLRSIADNNVGDE